MDQTIEMKGALHGKRKVLGKTKGEKGEGGGDLE